MAGILPSIRGKNFQKCKKKLNNKKKIQLIDRQMFSFGANTFKETIQ